MAVLSCIVYPPKINQSQQHQSICDLQKWERDEVNSRSLTKPLFRRSLSGFVKRYLLVQSLSETSSRCSDITGGKGSSLADLINLSKKTVKDLSVPRGLAVTSRAYQNQIKVPGMKNCIAEIETVAFSNPTNLKVTCDKVVNEMEKFVLLEEIQKELKSELEKEFGESYLAKRFAVRSSASGEDSEELSAAGQMTTYLGITGFDEICRSVIKCWASQFSFVAVEYKRQNGQVINSPMAVVVQEMIPAEVAGVMFTCDPVSGNPQNITITANYGIGESVVSASAEPDTIVLERNEDGLTGKIRVDLGKKNFQIIMSDSGGVVEEEISSEKSKVSCLPESKALQLASMGIAIEAAYGCPIDIEWGILNEVIYLLQARPITTFDKETIYDLRHELDAGQRSEFEIMSTCNIAEVMPGALSFLGASVIMKAIELPNGWHFSKRMKSSMMASTYFVRGGGRTENHNLFNIYDIVLRFYHGEQSMITDCLMVSFFGRLLEDEEMFKTAAKRNQYYPPNSVLQQTYYIIKDMLTCNGNLKRLREKLWNKKIDISYCKTSEEAHAQLWHQFLELVVIIAQHSTTSMVSSLFNLIVLSNLVSGNKGWGEDVYKDFAFFLGSCGEVESADVPSALEKLAETIGASSISKTFKNFSPKEAVEFLFSDKSKAGVSFREFLENHGHRGFKEFDPQSIPWGTDPEPLIKTIQGMVERSSKKAQKKTQSISDILSNLSVPLTWKNRLVLRLVLPLCQRAVGMRETSKSTMIKMFDSARKAYKDLANLMVKEGRLPDASLIYCLTHTELNYLIKTRSPLLVQKAIRRRNVLPAMDKVIYPEIMNGIPQAVNYESNVIKTGSVVAKGVPVCNGIAEGPARVARSLEEASEIKPGEILIAYATDIGWSPYFPMLAGVATEIGGLISHGAVVAREYGLPCIVGVESATLKFQTGDYVILNGSKGTLERLE